MIGADLSKGSKTPGYAKASHDLYRLLCAGYFIHIQYFQDQVVS